MAGPMLIMTAPTTAADRVALGVLNSHALEDAEVVFGVVGLLAMVTLRHDLAGINVLEQAFLGARDWTLLNGPHSPRGRAGRRQRTRAATFHASTDRSTAMSTTNSSTSSRAPRVRRALGFIAIIAFLVAALAACSSSGDSSDEWQPEPVSEVDLDENENEPDEYEPAENENEPGENENERAENENEPDENEADENEADEREEDENESDEGEEDEGDDELTPRPRERNRRISTPTPRCASLERRACAECCDQRTAR